MRKLLSILRMLPFVLFITGCISTSKPLNKPPRFNPRATDNAFPDAQYPIEPRKRGEQGLVIVAVLVLEDGSRDQVKLVKSCGFESLDNAVLEWYSHHGKFLPAIQEGKAVAAWNTIRVTFIP